MHDPERRALLRAAVVLLAVSAARWGVEAGRGGVEGGLGAEDALDGHLTTTAAAVEEEDRRTRPLSDGERIDPNTADVVELDRLPGVGPATAAAIIQAREGGAGFHRVDDLLAVRGIGPATLERMRPWLDLGSAGRPVQARGVTRSSTAPAARPVGAGAGAPVGRPPGPSDVVDVNRADLETLQRLPGIGPALARRIVEARSVRPFASVEELQRVRGIGPATVERLRSMAVVGARR